jgi:hypothetical protein
MRCVYNIPLFEKLECGMGHLPRTWAVSDSTVTRKWQWQCVMAAVGLFGPEEEGIMIR